MTKTSVTSMRRCFGVVKFFTALRVREFVATSLSNGQNSAEPVRDVIGMTIWMPDNPSGIYGMGKDFAVSTGRAFPLMRSSDTILSQ